MTSGVLDRAFALARSARGYLPGFGTSASLVAGAVLMFVVGSALVAFRGWPHVGAPPSPGEVVVSPSPTAASSSRASRRLALFSTGLPAAPGAGAVTAGGAAGGGRGAAGRRGGGGAGATAPQHTLGHPVSTSTPVGTTGGGTASSPAQPGSGGSAPTQPVQRVLSQTTGTLGGAVSGAGKQIGSVVQRSTGAVSGAVQPVSPPVASAVGRAGAGANQTVTGVTKTIAGVLSGLKHH
jgi:hypothetical protein